MPRSHSFPCVTRQDAWPNIFESTSYEGVSTSAFRNVVMIPLNLNGIMTIFWKAEVDSPTYVPVLNTCPPPPPRQSVGCICYAEKFPSLLFRRTADGCKRVPLQFYVQNVVLRSERVYSPSRIWVKSPVEACIWSLGTSNVVAMQSQGRIVECVSRCLLTIQRGNSSACCEYCLLLGSSGFGTNSIRGTRVYILVVSIKKIRHKMCLSESQ